MNSTDIINYLIEHKKPFVEMNSFSKLPGIYALFFIGHNFPVFEEAISQQQIIYIGKTLSSQEKRNAKTHFTSGKTGSSTVRKSIGSLLHRSKNLVPIPRNGSDYKKGRKSHFKFDYTSENIITNWMSKNLALGYFELQITKDEIDHLETLIIKETVPILNIDHKNPNNPYKNGIKKLRKECATIALEN